MNEFTNFEFLVALFLVVGIPCATIFGIAWLFVKGLKKDLNK